MTRERTDLDLGGVLGAWMNDAAPASIPVLVLEEAFARTMTASQVRVYPWQRVARRPGRSTRLTLLSVAATACLLVGILGLGLLGGGRHRARAKPDPVADRDPLTDPSRVPIAAAFPATPIVPTASVAVVRPQSLATDGTVLWVLSETGSVARIDPVTNTVGTGVQTGGTTDLYNGISVDANGVWVTDWDTTTLFRIDPTTSRWSRRSRSVSR